MDGAQMGIKHVQSKYPKIWPQTVFLYSMQLLAIFIYLTLNATSTLQKLVLQVFGIYLSDFNRKKASIYKIPQFFLLTIQNSSRLSKLCFFFY